MNRIMRQRVAARKRRLARRLSKDNFPDELGKPVMRATNPKYEVAERSVATGHGGVAVVHQLVRRIGLDESINKHLHLLQFPLPYCESDHVLNLAYNALCGGKCIEDLERLRHDEAYLNAIGAERIPDPTTAGDFCRRFQQPDSDHLHDAIDEARMKVWAEQPDEFFREAVIDVDGTIVETGGECKEGIDRAYNGKWGYSTLVLTLAQTGETLRLLNRPGNRPSHEGAAPHLTYYAKFCREAGFRKILFRGDTDFSQTHYLDGWDEQGYRFIFGMDVTIHKSIRADEIPESAWKPLVRPKKYQVKTQTRRRQERVKQGIVEKREYKDIRKVGESVAEIPYRPHACSKTYRMIIVRRDVEVRDPEQGRLFDDYRYFIYITNEPASVSATQVVLGANQRCNQENQLSQLNAARALYAPVNTLIGNEAYMTMVSLAWTLKAWVALSVPESPGRWQQQHREQKRKLLKMEFRTFLNSFMQIPCQVVHTGRRLVIRILAYSEWLPVIFRLGKKMSYPLRC